MTTSPEGLENTPPTATLRRSRWQRFSPSMGRMRMIADAGGAPSEQVVERFLNADGKHPVGNDHSGMPHFCTTKGLPIADWRDYQELNVNVGAPGGASVR